MADRQVWHRRACRAGAWYRHRVQRRRQLVVIKRLNIAVRVYVIIGGGHRWLDHQPSAYRDAVHQWHLIRPAGELEPARCG